MTPSNSSQEVVLKLDSFEEKLVEATQKTEPPFDWPL